MRSVFVDTLNTNLQIHSNEGLANFWLQTPIEGLDFPEMRTSFYEKPGEDGGVVPNQFYGPRGITFRGVVKGDTPALFEENRRALARAFAIKKDAFGVPIPTRIALTTLAGLEYFIDVFVQKKPIFNNDNVAHSKFLVNLLAPKSQIFGSSEASSGQIVRASGGGFILPVILPIVSSAGTGGSAIITNNGDAPTWPVLRLTGPLTNPYIQNATVGKHFQLNYTIPAAQYVDIDMENKTVLLNGESSLLSNKTSDSEWWQLDPDVNDIRFSTGSSADSGYLEITYHHAYLAV